MEMVLLGLVALILALYAGRMSKSVGRLITLGTCVLAFGSQVWADAPPATWADSITAALGTATDLFAVVVTLAVLVTGFFVGRSWLNRVK